MTINRSAQARVAMLAAAMTLLYARALFADGQGQRKEGEEQYIEHTVVVGVGGAAELEVTDGSLHPGANLMVEWDAIENWLELEAEASILFADHGTETSISATIKKPFHLARWAEFMVGVGPELVHVSTPTTRGTFFGGQMVLDFMFWPSQRVGFWIEPSYDLIVRDGLSHGVGSTGGLLLGW